MCHVPLAVEADNHRTDRKLGHWELAILLGSHPLALSLKCEYIPTVDLRTPGPPACSLAMVLAEERKSVAL